jgi:hypothetical protein
MREGQYVFEYWHSNPINAFGSVAKSARFAPLLSLPKYQLKTS